MTIAVTGATGHLGRLVIDALLARGVAASDLVAVGRSEERLAALAPLGVQTRVADYTDVAALTTAFAGVDRVLLVSSSEVGQRLPQHLNVITAAQDAGVALLAYTSIANVTEGSMALAAEHLQTELAIEESGLPHAFLRNGWYIENYTDQLGVQLQHGAVLGSAGTGKVSAATRADYAEAAAAVLLDPAPRESYELGGTPFTLPEYAATVTEVTGTPVVYTDLPAAEYIEALTGAGVPAPFAEILADSDLGLARGDLYVDSGDLSTLIGRPSTPLADVVRAATA
ncbi:SDR family oxidoreductase [Nocardioides sp.]|uniref:SDR family oxidoreductase n=1 Tax=Nocardioides sp. TaxID=35761 RepID=UPI00262B101C|nr:SDR family oxidoreductase [Nocardioides sp.]